MKTYNKSCCCGANKNKSIYDIEVMAQGNKPVKLEEYKGKVLLIVNTASMKLHKAQLTDFIEKCARELERRA